MPPYSSALPTGVHTRNTRNLTQVNPAATVVDGAFAPAAQDWTGLGDRRTTAPPPVPLTHSLTRPFRTCTVAFMDDLTRARERLTAAEEAYAEAAATLVRARREHEAARDQLLASLWAKAEKS